MDSQTDGLVGGRTKPWIERVRESSTHDLKRFNSPESNKTIIKGRFENEWKSRMG